MELFYVSMVEWFAAHKKITAVIRWMNKIVTILVMLSYPALLIYLLITKSSLLYRAIVVPLDGFIILSVFRYFVNRKRPYELYEIKPLIEKDTKGKSFPSRHVFSAVAIAATFWLWSPFPVLGVVIAALSVLLAAVRVMMGVHFISDVCAGIICGVACGLIGYVLL
ncbi:MAG: phosphatase PAP2 family protein [Lachnospiraceae bacterium]|nr:phosphatase PAP2 family protein [Lachnospiraceae bacterium]